MIPALPITLLFFQEPTASLWFNNVAIYSLFPLLHREGLSIPYFLLILIWNMLAMSRAEEKQNWRWPIVALHMIMVMSNIATFIIAPMSRYPDIHAMFNVVLSTTQFLFIWIYLNVRQFTQPRETAKVKID